jgi:hypothetical protein
MFTRNTHPLLIMLGCLLMLIALVSLVGANNLRPQRSAFTSGGDGFSAGTLRIDSAIGQPVAGVVGGELCSGILCGAAAADLPKLLPSPTATPSNTPTPRPTNGPTPTAAPAPAEQLFLPLTQR